MSHQKYWRPKVKENGQTQNSISSQNKSFKNKGKIKTFLNKQNQKIFKFITSRPVPQEILNNVLHTEEK